jgi:ABC-2 type transport system ATP-binding protein
MTAAQRLSELDDLLTGTDMSLATRRLMDLCDEYEALTDLSEEAMQLRAAYNMDRNLGAAELSGERGKAYATKVSDLVERIRMRGPLERTTTPPLQPEPVFRSNGLLKQFSSRGHRFGLGPINLELRTGSITGVVGENGNGKTTLLRQVAGLLDHDHGTLEHPGRSIDPYAIRSTIAWIPQRNARWHGTLLQNLRFTAAVHGLKGAANTRRVEHTLHRLGLTRFKDLTWSELSSGYKLRFELARMVVWRPRLLVLDEPIANLDLQAQQLFLQDLRHLASSRRHPVAVILSSQQLHEIEAVADTIVFLKNGQVAYSGAANAFDGDRVTNVYELKGDADRSRLLAALAPLGPVDLDDTGLVWRLTTARTVSARTVLMAVSQAGIELSYFRDISTSTRKLFHQDT